MSNLTMDGMALAPGVVETIITIAAGEVEGVARVGSPLAAGKNLLSVLRAQPSTSGVQVDITEDNAIETSVHIDVEYGSVLPDVAAKVREAVGHAVAGQVGAQVARVDVYIDGIQFND